MKGLTKRQIELLLHVKRGGSDGLLDFDQLLDLLSWVPSKESAQFTIRPLVRRGFLEKAGLQLRRGRKRVCYQLTEVGEQALDPRGGLPVAKKEVSVESLEAGDFSVPEVPEDFGLEILEG